MPARKVFSEASRWKHVEEIGRKLQARTDTFVAHQGRELVATAIEMQAQLGAGIHENPVVVFSNPRTKLKTGVSIVGSTIRVGPQLAKDLHEFRYTHAKNGADFRHPFDGKVQVWGIERNGQREFLLTHPDGLPLWDMFED